MLQPHQLLLFQGDSITNAFRLPDERNNAYRLGAGYALMIGAQLLLERPGDRLRFDNRGVSGNQIPNLLERWDEDCLALRPDVLSVLIGVNDAEAGTAPAEFERLYRELLTRTRAALPEIQFVLCEPFALTGECVTPQRAALVRGYRPVLQNLSAEFGAVFVELQAPLDRACQAAPPEFWIYDGLHPTAAGFALIARQWLEATREPCV